MNFEPLSYARVTECENQKDDWTLVTCEKIELLKPNQKVLVFEDWMKQVFDLFIQFLVHLG